MKMLPLALIALVPWVGIPARQSPSLIEGTVIKLGTGEPLTDASIQLNLEDQPVRSAPGEPRPSRETQRTAKSDRNGRFIFDNVAAGRYRLIATYDDGGYVPAEYGQRAPTEQGSSFVLLPGQKMTGIQLGLVPTGAITGRVYDKDGEPLGRAQVIAMRPIYKNGDRTLTIVQIVATDDRGEYRLFWLPPATYYVSAKPDITEITVNIGQPNSYLAPVVRITPPMRFGTFEQATSPSIRTRRLKTGEIVEEMYLPVYYPGTTDLQGAAAISVAAGATVGGVDFTPDIGLIRAHHIRGRIIDGTTGQPVAQASVRAVPRTNNPHFTITAAQSNPQGLFDLAGVPPGSYQVFVTRYGEGLTPLNNVVHIEVAGENIDNLPIVAVPEFKLSGRFLMENGSRSYPRVANLVREPAIIGMAPAGPSYNPAAAADGSFTLDGVGPGDFRVTLQGVPPDGYVKSMRLGNADVLNDGLHMTGPPEGLLEIVIGANAGSIEGTVLNARQEALSNRTVVLVPDFRLRHRLDLYKVVSTDGAGQFLIEGVTPGEYKLFAWDYVESGAWQHSAFIGAYDNAGRPVHIYEGSSEKLQLTLIP